MNSTQIKCFISLGKTLNFSKTAKELYLTQPTVSKNVKNLEKEIGISLIERRHKKIQLTKEGKYFYQNIVQLDKSFNIVIKNLKNKQLENKKTIKIGFLNIPFEQQYLPFFLKEIHKKINGI